MQNQHQKTETLAAVALQPLVRKPRHKWFAHTCKDADNGWNGPHDHMEGAARAALLAWEAEGDTCWISQGRKLRKSEYEEQGAEYTWEVDVQNAMMLRLPNAEAHPQPGERHSTMKGNMDKETNVKPEAGRLLGAAPLLGHMPATTEIVYTHPNGREEVRYRRSYNSREALELVEQVLDNQNRHGAACPYSFRHVS